MEEVVEEDGNSTVDSCPLCGGATYWEPILGGDPEAPDVIDALQICEDKGCDIMGWYMHTSFSGEDF